MELRGLALLLVLVGAVGIAGQGPSEASPAVTLTEADRLIADLRQKTKELAETRTRFLRRLDEAITRFDSGSRTNDGRRIPAADAGLTNGPADITSTAVRKFFAARMLGARGSGDQPPALSEMDRLQYLIGQARTLVDSSQIVIRGVLVVSARELDARTEGTWKAKHDELLKARLTLEQTAQQAYATLPIDLPYGDTAAERKERAWDLFVMGSPVPKESEEQNLHRSPVEEAPPAAPSLPIRLERGRRITLLNEPGFRFALTDSGIEDEKGRHVFYQEEWMQRGLAVLRLRQRVAVDTITGEHILIKHYEARERHGSLDELYSHRDRDYLWYIEPTDQVSEPSRLELESAIAGVVRSRESIRSAIADYKATIRQSLNENDANDPEATPDSGLPDSLRGKLFAIRSHLAQVRAVVGAEARVENAIEKARESISQLEPLAALGNRAIADGAISSAEWERFQNRADDEIVSTNEAASEARASLPPDLSNAEGKFPPLQKDVIVHMVRRSSWDSSEAAMRCLQEVWRLATSIRGSRRVQRTVTVIEVDRGTGKQKNVGISTQYYVAGPYETLEGIYDQFAAQDISVSGVR